MMVAAAASVILLMLGLDAVVAAPAMAVYRGELAGAPGPSRKIELHLKADGTMSLITDLRNNRAPVTEEGRWNAVSVEQIDLIIERRDGAAVSPPAILHFTKNGETLQTTPESSAQFSSQGLQLRQTRIAAAPSAAVPGSIAQPIGIWRWEAMVSSDAAVPVEQPERYTLELQNGGKLLVRADCNRGQGSYKLNGRAINIKVSVLTRAACPPGSLSDRFLKSLEAAAGQRSRGDNLFIDLPGAGGTMKFGRAKAAP
jgi:heat shock protein HslJ